MAIAKIEPLPKFDFGEKLLEWKQRHAEGKELRRAVPRESHAEWKPRNDRPDPLKLLAESNKVLETFVARGQLQKLAEPTTLTNGKRIPGLKLDHPRQLAVMHALVRFANCPASAGNGERVLSLR